jgi:hypothetical protein
MGYLKLIPYLFLVAGIVFFVSGIDRYNSGDDYIISFLFSGLAIFMFFFRRWQYKKFSNRDNTKE